MAKDTSSPKAYLVESIPTGMDDLKVTEGVGYTGAVLKQLTDNAQESIDLTAMYWALRPNPGRDDEKGFLVEELIEKFGADEGQALFDALKAAAGRGVRIRIIESPGFDSSDDESKVLQYASPGQIEIHRINMEDWYGSGIMHQKLWIFDGKSVYLGSANMDWKSLSQVKEIGIVVEDNVEIAGEMGRYFDTWWAFSGLEPTVRENVFDPAAMIERTVPAWSELVRPGQRTTNPLDCPEFRTGCSWESPLPFDVDGESARALISGAPKGVCVGERTFDGDALVRTILEAESSVCICVMDFAPVSLYRGAYDTKTHKYMVGDKVATPVWWPALFDAVLHVVTTKALHVRLLISEWAHTSEFVTPYLQALQAAAQAGGAKYSMGTGILEIKRFHVPGWESTGSSSSHAHGKTQAYPGHTRVNHTKYIVTDKRANIGTSNMTWDYFSGTAGASFNTDHQGLVGKLQEIFDRDWNSRYATPQARKQTSQQKKKDVEIKTENVKLKKVLSLIEETVSQGDTPIVVFDLDSTLFTTAPRNLRIIREFAADQQDTYPGFATAAAQVTLKELGWDLHAPLIAHGVDPDSPALDDLDAYWEVNFFMDDYVALDMPTPGAVDFVQVCYDKGALIYYLTGRYVGKQEYVSVDSPSDRTRKLVVTPGMEFGTAQALTSRGFPFWRGRCELHLKPDFHVEDVDFKDEALRTIHSLNGRVVATFDNEPGNANLFLENFPEAMNFWLETIHSKGAEEPDARLYRIEDFKQAKAEGEKAMLNALNDKDGTPVDWWFMYKLPDNVGPTKTTGYEYLYYDAETEGRLALSARRLDETGGALNTTLEQIFSNSGDNEGNGWILYNDEVPVGDDNDGSKGHCKGVLAFNKRNDSGLLLIHSTPRFPNEGETTLPDKERIYGQTFLCITLADYATANALAEQLRLQQDPQVYAAQLDDDIAASESLSKFANGDNEPVPTAPSVITIKSRAGKEFQIIAKNRVWGDDFWIDLVAPTLDCDIKVESWRRGTVPPEEKKGDPDEIDDVQYINLAPLGLDASYRWHYTKDHAKWGISESGEHSYVCVGDINRMVSQEKRSGGTAAFIAPQLWKDLDAIEELAQEAASEKS